MKPYYSSLCSKTRVDFPAKEIQGSQAPLTMLFFSLGKQYQGKILTIEMLMKRKWMMVNRCGLCKANNHILIHCERTRQLWTFLLAIFSLKWVFPAIIKNHRIFGFWQMLDAMFGKWIPYVYYGAYEKSRTTEFLMEKSFQIKD